VHVHYFVRRTTKVRFRYPVLCTLNIPRSENTFVANASRSKEESSCNINRQENFGLADAHHTKSGAYSHRVTCPCQTRQSYLDQRKTLSSVIWRRAYSHLRSACKPPCSTRRASPRPAAGATGSRAERCRARRKWDRRWSTCGKRVRGVRAVFAIVFKQDTRHKDNVQNHSECWVFSCKAFSFVGVVSTTFQMRRRTSQLLVSRRREKVCTVPSLSQERSVAVEDRRQTFGYK
jgi:hypothetical protein